MNVDEIDTLFPLIVDDNFKELYPLVLNIKDLSQSNPLIYETIADRFAKKNWLDTVRLKFLKLLRNESKEAVQRFYNFTMAEFYLNVISHHKNRSVVLRLLNMLHKDHLPNLTQIISKIKANDYVFPSRLISWLGELLIFLNLYSPPIPSEYVKITANYLNNMLRAIEKDYYSKDFPSFIEVIAIYFRLFGILLNIIFYRVDEWDDRCIDKYGGELEDYHDQSLDLVLNHEIKLQIHNNVLTIKNEDLFVHSMPIKKITEFNSLKLQFTLQRDKIIKNKDIKASWLTEHLESVLSESDFNKIFKKLKDKAQK